MRESHIMARKCWWNLMAVVLVCGATAHDASGEESPQVVETALAQPELVQPRLAPRRRAARARRYLPRGPLVHPQPLPAPQGQPTEVKPPSDAPLSPDTQPAANADGKQPAKEPLIAPPSRLPTLMLQPPSNSPGTPAPFSTKLNLNRATIEQIQRLPGMTPGVAARILAGRPYRRIGELGAIGIPSEIILSIAPVVSFDP
jgi:competence protein ComEA